MRRRDAGINAYEINESEQRFSWGSGRLPTVVC